MACLMVMLWPLILPKLVTYYIGHKIGTKEIERAQAEKNIKAKEEAEKKAEKEAEKEAIAEQEKKEEEERIRRGDEAWGAKLQVMLDQLEEGTKREEARGKWLQGLLDELRQKQEEFDALKSQKHEPVLLPRSARWEHRINASPRPQRLENEE